MEHGEAALVHPRGRDYPSGRGKFNQAIPRMFYLLPVLISRLIGVPTRLHRGLNERGTLAITYAGCCWTCVC